MSNLDKIYPDLEEYLGEFYTICYNRNYRLDLSNPSEIKATPEDPYLPTIVGKYEDWNRQFWFNPTIKFPSSEIHSDGSSFTYLASKWSDAAKIADYLLDHSWLIED